MAYLCTLQGKTLFACFLLQYYSFVCLGISCICIFFETRYSFYTLHNLKLNLGKCRNDYYIQKSFDSIVLYLVVGSISSRWFIYIQKNKVVGLSTACGLPFILYARKYVGNCRWYIQETMQYAGLQEPGVPRHSQILADQSSPPHFQTFLRPCSM